MPSFHGLSISEMRAKFQFLDSDAKIIDILLYFGKLKNMNDKNDIWKDEQLRQLADVLASISDPNEIRAFLRDVMTQKEIIEVGARLQAAKMLSKG